MLPSLVVSPSKLSLIHTNALGTIRKTQRALSVIESIMSETNEPSVFLAKDGVSYSTYSEMRDANIRYNEKILALKGLDGASFQALRSKAMRNGSTSRSVSGSSQPLKKKGGSFNEKSLPLRRSSRRKPRMIPELHPQAEEQFHSLDKQVNISVRSTASPTTSATDYSSGDTPARDVPRKKKKAHISPNYQSLTESQRNVLRSYDDDDDWISQFESYLLREEKISDANYRSVVRQVVKLVTGAGVAYARWNEGVIFAPQRRIHLSDDMDCLYDEAVEFEDMHGRDLGNGWLLRHPIRKLGNFQSFLVNGGK